MLRIARPFSKHDCAGTASLAAILPITQRLMARAHVFLPSMPSILADGSYCLFH